MYGEILDFLGRRPPEYADSTDKFWDDEHISKQMLEAHLNPDWDAASRNHAFIWESARWIAGEIKTPGAKLLDLGCGPGLYAERFAELGLSVTGVDFSRRSIDYASARDKRITYLYQNYLDIAYENAFDAATLIYCDFGVLKPADRAALLKKVVRALKPGGVLVLDAWTGAEYADFTEKRSVEYKDCGFWSGEPYACIKSDYRYGETYLEQHVIITRDKLNCYNIWNRAFSAESLTLELREAGFKTVRFFANARGDEWRDDSKTICAVARS